MKNKTGKKISDAKIEDLLGAAIDNYFENPEAVRNWISIRIAVYDELMKTLQGSKIRPPKRTAKR